MSLRKKIILTASSLLVLAGIIAFFSVRTVFSNYRAKRIGFVNSRSSQLIADQIKTILTGYENLTTSIGSSVLCGTDQAVEDQYQNTVIRLKKIENKNSAIVAIHVFIPNREVFSSKKNLTEAKKENLKNIFLLARDSLYFSSFDLSSSTLDTIFTIAAPVKSAGKTSAIVSIDFSATEIYRVLRKPWGPGKTDCRFLVNRSGLIVSPVRNDPEAVFKKRISLIKKDESGHTIVANNSPAFYTNYAGTSVLGNRSKISGLNCLLFSEISQDEAFEPLGVLSRLLLILFVSIFIMTLFGMFYISGKITRPLKLLKYNTERIERGDFDFEIDPVSNDEIGDLANSFNLMRRHIQENEKKLKSYAEELEEEVQKRTRLLDEKVDLLQTQKQESLAMASQLENINNVLQEEIAERQKAEAALTESEMRYRNVSEITSDYAYGLLVEEDGKLRNMWTSGAFENMTGYKSEAIEEKGGWEYLIHPEDVAIALKQVGVFLTGKPSASEYRIVTKQGEVRWVRDYGRPEWDAEKQRVTYIYGAIQDITQQRNAEDKLRQSEASYRELFDSAIDSIYIQDKNGVFLSVNRGAENMYGYPKEHFIGNTPEIVAAPGKNDLDKVAQLIDLAFQGKPQQFEFWGKRKNGEIFPKEVRIQNGHYFGKKVIVGFAHDISERKANERKLRTLSQTVEQSPVQVLLADKKRQIEYVNKSFIDVTGYTLSEVLGKSPEFLRPEDEDAKIYENMWKHLEKGEIWQNEVVSEIKSGERIFEEVTASPLFDEGGEVSHYIAFKIDITARKKLEEEFRQSQKMEAIGRLAGGVAHDFNNLLTVIIGYSELMLAQISEEDPLYARIRQIDKAGRRAESLTRQLLAFSRKQILQPRVINLNQMINDMEKMLRRLIGEHIELLTNLPEELGNLKADPGQIEQVIMNLCINARDAMPEGGELIITTSTFEQIEEQAESPSDEVPLGSYIRLDISDTGMGMDESLQARIFEPFFTTKEKGKGTGLGLSTVYGIIKQSNGYIFVRSQKDRGTTFQIFFPQVSEAEEADGYSGIPISELEGGETILLVEDEDALRDLAVETMGNAGYHILTAEDGEQALQVALNYNDAIDLLLTDVVMPKLGGKKLADAIIKMHPEIKILFFGNSLKYFPSICASTISFTSLSSTTLFPSM